MYGHIKYMGPPRLRKRTPGSSIQPPIQTSIVQTQSCLPSSRQKKITPPNPTTQHLPSVAPSSSIASSTDISGDVTEIQDVSNPLSSTQIQDDTSNKSKRKTGSKKAATYLTHTVDLYHPTAVAKRRAANEQTFIRNKDGLFHTTNLIALGRKALDSATRRNKNSVSNFDHLVKEVIIRDGGDQLLTSCMKNAPKHESFSIWNNDGTLKSEEDIESLHKLKQSVLTHKSAAWRERHDNGSTQTGGTPDLIKIGYKRLDEEDQTFRAHVSIASADSSDSASNISY